MAMTSNAGVGDNSYKGNGTIRCGACGEPIRDHKVAFPCPEMGVPIFYVDRPGYQGRAVSPEAQRKRRQREREKESK